MKTDGNDSISPTTDMGQLMESGLTKREYFAALAMQGMIQQDFPVPNGTSRAEIVASGSVAYADALITALNKGASNE
jgi:hypothetical protein